LVHVWSTSHRNPAVPNGLQRSPVARRSRRPPPQSWGNKPRSRTLIRMKSEVQVLPGPLPATTSGQHSRRCVQASRQTVYRMTPHNWHYLLRCHGQAGRRCRGWATSGHLSLPLPGLSGPPSPCLWALPCRLPGPSADSARWSPAESLPFAGSPELAARDGWGWLLGGLAASAAPRARPGATAVLVWVSSSFRPRATR
jgi:hypothetical protein